MNKIIGKFCKKKTLNGIVAQSQNNSKKIVKKKKIIKAGHLY